MELFLWLEKFIRIMFFFESILEENLLDFFQKRFFDKRWRNIILLFRSQTEVFLFGKSVYLFIHIRVGKINDAKMAEKITNVLYIPIKFTANYIDFWNDTNYNQIKSFQEMFGKISFPPAYFLKWINKKCFTKIWFFLYAKNKVPILQLKKVHFFKILSLGSKKTEKSVV